MARPPISANLLAPCATFADEKDPGQLDLDAFVRRLLLHEVYTLRSRRLREVPLLVEALGCDGLLKLLDSGVLQIHCDPTTIGSVGQSFVRPRQWGLPPLPLGEYQFAVVRSASRDDYLANCFSGLELPGLSRSDVERLRHGLTQAIVATPADFGDRTIADLESLLRRQDPLITEVARHELKRSYPREPMENLALEVTQTGQNDFRVASNVARPLGWSDEEAHKFHQLCALATSRICQRIEEMETYDALSGFQADEAPLFGQRLEFLRNALSPDRDEEQFIRVLEISGFPTVAHKSVNVDYLLKARESAELLEFRQWLLRSRELSDEEVGERLRSIRSRLGNLASSSSGRVLRFLASAGAGLAVGPAGLGLAAADKFLLKQIVPRDGAVAFVGKLFPSIFDTDRRSNMAIIP